MDRDFVAGHVVGSTVRIGHPTHIEKGFAVFVTDFTTAAWFGLDPAEALATRN